VILTFLWVRNACFDRANVVFHVPVVLQEILQAALWPHVGDDGNSCDGANMAISFLVTLVVLGLPFWSASLGKVTQFLVQDLLDRQLKTSLSQGHCPRGHDLIPFETDVLHYYCSVCGQEELNLLTRMWGCRLCDFDACESCRFCAEHRNVKAPVPALRCLLGRPQWQKQWATAIPPALGHATRWSLCMSFTYAVFGCCIVYMRIYGAWTSGSIFEGPRCTTRGPHGHQIWPMMVWEARLWLRFLLSALYFIVGGSFVLIPKPSYMPAALNALSFVAMALFVSWGDEWGSVWCWFASVLCILYIVEPVLFRRYRVFDEEVLESASLDSVHVQRKSFGFFLARGHFLQAMLPWDGVRPLVPQTCRARLERPMHVQMPGTA